MRIIFMGTPDFAVPCLAKLCDDGHEIVGVFTQPDRPKGRGHKLTAPPVKEFALKAGLSVYQPEKLKDNTVLDIFRTRAPDLVVVVAYGRILPKALLDVPKYGCINVHGSLLPKYRGAAPIQWSVINGDEFAGVTTMYMSEGLDCGDILLTESTPVGENETSGELYERLAPIGANLLSRTVKQIESGNISHTPQNNDEASIAPMLNKEMGKIDFNLSARRVHKLICGMNPWPMAFTKLDGQIVKIYKSALVQGNGKPGKILTGNGLIIACGEDAVEILELQMQGGKRMNAVDFMRGHPLHCDYIG